MGTNNNFKTTKHTKHTETEDGVELEPRRGTEKPKNHEWTRMGTNNIFKTTKHTKHTETEDGVGLEPWKGIFSGNGVIVSE